ncbi:hypothetical protein J3A83DRAFT_4194399 [Scleroderma citrinum]
MSLVHERTNKSTCRCIHWIIVTMVASGTSSLNFFNKKSHTYMGEFLSTFKTISKATATSSLWPVMLCNKTVARLLRKPCIPYNAIEGVRPEGTLSGAASWPTVLEIWLDRAEPWLPQLPGADVWP